MSDDAAPRQWTLRRRIGQGFVGAALVIAVLAAAVIVSTVQFVQAANRVVDRWEPAASAAQRLLTDVVVQDASLRGYALSRDPALAARVHAFDAAQRRDSVALAHRLGGDAPLRAQMAALDAAVARWQQRIASPGLAAVTAGDASAGQLLAGREAQRLFAAIRHASDALADDIAARSDTVRADRRTFGTIFGIAMSLTAAMLVVLAVAIWRGLHRWVLTPVDRLGAQTREVARGETYRQIVPTGPLEFAALARDVEAMRLQITGELARAEEIQAELRLRTEELVRSNADLQQFAYVASHDLSEPLRKVANFCQLLERQYADELDDRARQYIDFAVDGAKRMQALIADLLALSRVGRTTDQFVAVGLDAVLDAALTTLAERIGEAGARIERRTPLPAVAGDPTLLASLFENLVGNAIKYRRPDVAPVVEISAEHSDAEHAWTITVADNGIGIDPQYAERIFAVFQRLHVRDAYGGTGIGLAICRKIVEFHGGRIWLENVESSPGATFRFVLPEGGPLAESRD